jgi:hypothetical protein
VLRETPPPPPAKDQNGFVHLLSHAPALLPGSRTNNARSRSGVTGAWFGRTPVAW